MNKKILLWELPILGFSLQILLRSLFILFMQEASFATELESQPTGLEQNLQELQVTPKEPTQFDDLPYDLLCAIFVKYWVETDIATLPAPQRVSATCDLILTLVLEKHPIARVFKKNDWAKHATFADTLVVAREGNLNDYDYQPAWTAFVLASENPHIVANQYKSQALTKAASHGQLEVCRKLLNLGAQVSETRGKALALAASNGHVKVCDLLIEKSTQDNKEGAAAEAFDLAAYHNRLEVCLLLLEKKVLNPEEKAMALMKAIERGNTPLVILLLDRGAQTGNAGIQALTAASSREEIYQLFLT